MLFVFLEIKKIESIKKKKRKKSILKKKKKKKMNLDFIKFERN